MIFTKIRIISADSKHVTDKLSNNALRWLGNVALKMKKTFMSVAFTLSTYFYRLGAYIRTANVGTEQDFRVIKIIKHPSYNNPKRYSHDIALLKLDKPAALDR